MIFFSYNWLNFILLYFYFIYYIIFWGDGNKAIMLKSSLFSFNLT